MSASMDNAGSAGAVQTWPLTTAAAATAVPLPAEAKAPPHPSPLPQAGEGWGEGKPAAGETQTVAMLANESAATTASTAPTANFNSPTTATTSQASSAPSFGEPTGAAGAVGGTVLALLLVVGVILALAWLAKRMPGIGTGGGNPSLKIVGSLALGPRERVIVVAVGDTQLLLSTGPHGTRALHTLSEPLPVTAASPSPFAQVLAQQFGRKKS